jgi:K(+)-stimulated pyrophosphate-energized sodium pump
VRCSRSPELIYETCKTYLITQGKFILILEVFIGTIMVVYFGPLARHAGHQGDHHRAVQLIGIAALLWSRGSGSA